MGPILRQFNQVHYLISYFCKIHFNSIFQLHLVFPSFLYPMHAHCPTDLILLDLITLLILGDENEF